MPASDVDSPITGARFKGKGVNYDEEDSDSSTDLTFSAAKKLQKQRLQRRVSAASEQHEEGQRKTDQKRSRRRSSARFLRLSTNNNIDEPESATREDLGNMYKTIMKLNNENKINATNSWGLKLIENLDKVLEYDEEEDLTDSRPNSENREEKGVNFTKASCTLDASIRIYAYRVDDAHLSSYKVLANLNRTDSANASSLGGPSNANDQDNDEEGTAKRITKHSRVGTADTLESNLANINMNKLDSAYDIDPLFHKMSKKFDEGGAKGLLLANLDIAWDNCAIVFDSKDDQYSRDDGAQLDEPNQKQVKQLDITSLVTNLRSLLNGASIQSIPLVPQLESLREEYKQLDAEGYIESDVQLPKTKRYENSVEEEKEAERSIHLEAIERSRMSAMNLTFATSDDSRGRQSSMSYAPNDFGGGDDDNDSNNGGFSDFMVMEDETPTNAPDSPAKLLPPPSVAATTTANFLDMICTTNDAIQSTSSFAFIDPSALEKFVSGNNWAGSAHWKKSSAARKKSLQKENIESILQPETMVASKKKTKETTIKYVDLYKVSPEIESLFEAPKKSRKTRNDPLQLTDATKKKNMKTNNCLPLDSSITLRDLTSLFGRPNDQLMRTAPAGVSIEESTNRRKTVAFYDTAEPFDDGVDDSYDDGPGFNFTGDEDGGRVDDFTRSTNFVEKNIVGVRLIEKVSIGYATVAKRVDVRSLKKNLWAELEARIGDEEKFADIQEEDSVSTPLTSFSVPIEKETATVLSPEQTQVSFQSIVNTMDSKQTQADATVPFYFICLLHLANEKGLFLDSSGMGLEDFLICKDGGETKSADRVLSVPSDFDKIVSNVESKKGKRSRVASYTHVIDEDCNSEN